MQNRVNSASHVHTDRQQMMPQQRLHLMTPPQMLMFAPRWENEAALTVQKALLLCTVR